MFRLGKVHELSLHWEQRQDRRIEHKGLSEKTEENLDTPPACSSPLPSSPSLSFPLLSSPRHSSPLLSTPLLFSPLHMSVNALLWQRHPGQLGWRLGGDHRDDFRQTSSVAHTFNKNLKTKKRVWACLFVFVYTPLFAVLTHAMSKGKKSSPSSPWKNMPRKCVESAWKSNPIDTIFTLCHETLICVGSVIPD